MPDMPLIGFAGLAGSGKDTAVEAIVRFCGGNVNVFSFADPMIEALSAAGILDKQRWRESRPYKEGVDPRFGKSRREIMQTFGTDWGRNMIDPDIWVRLAMEQVERLKNAAYESGPILFSDVRFSNEAAYIRNWGTLVHVLRPHLARINEHPSEDGVGIQPGDEVLFNDGTTHEFEQLVIAWFRERC